MTFAVLVALFEQPAITTFRIGQDLPAIVVAIPKEETVGAVLKMRFGDFLEMPAVCITRSLRTRHEPRCGELALGDYR